MNGSLHRHAKAKPATRIGRVCNRLLERSPIPSWLLDFNRFHCFELPPLNESHAATEQTHTQWLDLPSFQQISHQPGFSPQPNAEKRIKKGDRCLGLFLNNQCIGYIWVREHSNTLEDRHRCRMLFPPQSAYLFDAFLLPQHRHQGYYGHLLRQVQQHLLPQGYQKFYLIVDCYNRRAVKALLKFNPHLVGSLLYIALLNHAFYYCRTHNARHYALLPLKKIHEITLPIPHDLPTTPKTRPKTIQTQ